MGDDPKTISTNHSEQLSAKVLRKQMIIDEIEQKEENNDGRLRAKQLRELVNKLKAENRRLKLEIERLRKPYIVNEPPLPIQNQRCPNCSRADDTDTSSSSTTSSDSSSCADTIL